jgi:hypothetical protein
MIFMRYDYLFTLAAIIPLMILTSPAFARPKLGCAAGKRFIHQVLRRLPRLRWKRVTG